MLTLSLLVSRLRFERPKTWSDVKSLTSPIQ
ncbi:hypothetical protein CbuG_0846 [Coxiella burnetii CbuG_Q212]|nr:hypothetical protein CbuG_0846 [Coxiella burnetii CbuG_Q212]